MKKTCSILFLFITAMLSAQDQYTKGMQKAMQLWGDQKLIEASNLFERIAIAEDDNWLPYYYVAMVNTTASFAEKDEKKLQQQLEKAKEYVNTAKSMSPDNAEIVVLEAMINTAWVVYDGATYGPTLSAKITQLYQKAKKLAPKNPRVILSKAEWDMGSARFFGKDTEPYCEDIEKSIELFATFKAESEFHPNWGLERAELVTKECK